MKYLCVLGSAAALLAFASCTKPVICTDEFVIVSLTVGGGTLTDYYTVRTATGDTIRHTGVYNSSDNWYPVLTDDYHPMMKRKTEEYRFIGLIEGRVVIDEAYEINANRCHITRVNGKREIAL